MRLVATVALSLLVSTNLLACGTDGPEVAESDGRLAGDGTGSSDGGGGGQGATGAVAAGFEIFDVVGDADTLVIRGRGLAKATATLEQGGSMLPLEILTSDDRELRVVVPAAASPGSASLLVHAGGGSLRREVVLLRGPRGEAGTVGPAGPEGSTGEAGPVGPQGPRGEAGERGEQGIQGPRGPTGAVGARGEKGERGLTGTRGAQGPAGARGPTGDDGVLAVDILSPGTANFRMSGSTTWQRIGTARTVTVQADSTLVIHADVGGIEPYSHSNIYTLAGGPIEFGLEIDGIVIPSGQKLTVPRNESHRSFFWTRGVRAGNHTVRLVVRCATSSYCYASDIPLADQRLLVLQVTD